MSTRRTTRAASRQASSRAVSPAPSAAATATPRRTRRAGNEPLPAIGLRQSTAYGTNTVAPPARITGPVVSEQINNVLNDLLAPSGSGTQTQRTPTPTPSPDKSFGIESGLFYGAHVESSPVSEPPRTSPEPPPDSNGVPYKDQAEIERLQELARTRLAQVGRAGPGPIQTSIRNLPSRALSFVIQFINFLYSLVTAVLSVDILKYVVVALAMFLIYEGVSSGTVSFPSNLGESLGRLIPHDIKHPIDYFSTEDVRLVKKRISDLEYEVALLKTHSSELDSKTLTRLEEILPDLLVLKKDRQGSLLIPDDFWLALRDKILADDSLIQSQLDGPVSKGALSGKELTKEVERVAKSAWDRYMKQNSNTLKNVLASELADKFPRLVQEHHIATKEEVVDLMKKYWEENSSHLQSEVSQLNKKLEQTIRSVTRLHGTPSHLTREEIQAIVTETCKKFIPNTQLGGLANSEIHRVLEESLARPNHFSKATGAVIDPLITSPTYVFPSNDVWFPQRWMRSLIGNPITPPNPPEAALTRWEEYGDCWCSNAEDSAGVGPSLGVITGHTIYPEQVVIEHIPSISTLEPGSAPREMELFAYVPELEIYNAAFAVSEELFPREVPEAQLPFRYVRIASWTYDQDSTSVQAFDIPVNMRSLGAETNKLIVRAKNNWGQNVPYTCLYRIRVHGEVVAQSEEVVV